MIINRHNEPNTFLKVGRILEVVDKGWNFYLGHPGVPNLSLMYPTLSELPIGPISINYNSTGRLKQFNFLYESVSPQELDFDVCFYITETPVIFFNPYLPLSSPGILVEKFSVFNSQFRDISATKKIFSRLFDLNLTSIPDTRFIYISIINTTGVTKIFPPEDKFFIKLFIEKE